MSWQHIRPDSLAWQPLGPGIETRDLTTKPFPVRQYRIAPNSAAELQGLLLVQSGAAVSPGRRGVTHHSRPWVVDGSASASGPVGSGSPISTARPRVSR